MVSNKAMSIANTEAFVINKLANCKPPVLAKKKMKQFNIHVNLKTWKKQGIAGPLGKQWSKLDVP